MYAVASARRSHHQSIIYSLVAPIPTDLRRRGSARRQLVRRIYDVYLPLYAPPPQKNYHREDLFQSLHRNPNLAVNPNRHLTLI